MLGIVFGIRDSLSDTLTHTHISKHTYQVCVHDANSNIVSSVQLPAEDGGGCGDGNVHHSLLHNSNSAVPGQEGHCHRK